MGGILTIVKATCTMIMIRVNRHQFNQKVNKFMLAKRAEQEVEMEHLMARERKRKMSSIQREDDEILLENDQEDQAEWKMVQKIKQKVLRMNVNERYSIEKFEEVLTKLEELDRERNKAA